MQRLGGAILIASLASWGIAVAEPMTLVKGRLIFPSDSMPAQKVRAVSTSTRKRLCTMTEEGDEVFAMRLPPGRYFFSAEANGIKAWMTTFNRECKWPVLSMKFEPLQWWSMGETASVAFALVTGILNQT